jgi:hypothetical protein
VQKSRNESQLREPSKRAQHTPNSVSVVPA